MNLDPRLTPVRADLASQALEGLVRAPRFIAPRAHQAIAPRAALRLGPDRTAEQASQLLLGERFDVLDLQDGFAWGQAMRDGYVGWVEAEALAPAGDPPTHRVTALAAFLFATPSIKAPVLGPVGLNALVRAVGEDGEFLAVARPDGGGEAWVPRRHLAGVGEGFVAPADAAERFVGTPYLWGGRDSLGLDCSGLVQQALFAAGLACPRDSDQQARLGAALDADDLRRGDLVFWRGHVGMMLDSERLIHANAFHMAVAVEPLAEARARIAARGGGDPTAWRRPLFAERDPSAD